MPKEKKKQYKIEYKIMPDSIEIKKMMKCNFFNFVKEEINRGCTFNKNLK